MIFVYMSYVMDLIVFRVFAKKKKKAFGCFLWCRKFVKLFPSIIELGGLTLNDSYRQLVVPTALLELNVCSDVDPIM